jgi:hypothetical protein
VTLSLPVRIVALVGLLVALALGGVLALSASRHDAATEPVVPVVHHATTPRPAPPKPALHLDPRLPAPLRHALEHSRTVVAVLYAPHVAADTPVLAAARDGARDARVGFAAIDVSRDAVASKLAAWLPEAADPAVLVVHRPGRVVTVLDGWSDRTMVTQAAAAAR